MDEELDKIDIILDEYKDGKISKEKCISDMRKVWGKCGFQISAENAEIYLDIQALKENLIEKVYWQSIHLR